MKDELGGQIMEELTGIRAKTYRCLNDNYHEDKEKAKNTKKCVIKRNANPCYMETDSFNVHVKPEHIYQYIAKDVE